MAGCTIPLPERRFLCRLFVYYTLEAEGGFHSHVAPDSSSTLASELMRPGYESTVKFYCIIGVYAILESDSVWNTNRRRKCRDHRQKWRLGRRHGCIPSGLRCAALYQMTEMAWMAARNVHGMDYGIALVRSVPTWTKLIRV